MLKRVAIKILFDYSLNRGCWAGLKIEGDSPPLIPSVLLKVMCYFVQVFFFVRNRSILLMGTLRLPQSITLERIPPYTIASSQVPKC